MIAAQDEKLLADGVEGLADLAAAVLRRADSKKFALATAESCTGGLIASLLTDIEGLSSGFERGFVVYTDAAKAQMLGVDPIEIARHGAVSEAVARAMAHGVIEHSEADLAVAVTGFAGPGGKHDEEGLVHLAAVSRQGRVIHRECHFGQGGRDRTRHLAARAALEMLDELFDLQPGARASVDQISNERQEQTNAEGYS